MSRGSCPTDRSAQLAFPQPKPARRRQLTLACFCCPFRLGTNRDHRGLDLVDHIREPGPRRSALGMSDRCHPGRLCQAGGNQNAGADRDGTGQRTKAAHERSATSIPGRSRHVSVRSLSGQNALSRVHGLRMLAPHPGFGSCERLAGNLPNRLARRRVAPNRAIVPTASIPTHPLRIKTGSLATATSLIHDAF